MALKKSQLYSSLWASCDELRGGMDASQYKDYVLVLLFVKYVSDRYAGQPYAAITIPPGASFADMVALKGKPDIGDQINKKILGPLAQANKLADMPDFNDPAKLGSGKEMVERLTNLVAIFENPALDFSKNRADGDDLLGDAYEYLMRHFATESGKSKGQFYTPAEVSRVIAQLLGVRRASATAQTTVYDPTCGSGSLLLKVAEEAAHGRDVRVTLYGQEKDNATAGLARMNMILHDYATAEIRQGNTLVSPLFLKGDALDTFDYVVANPPFSDKSWSTGLDPEHDPYDRFAPYGVPPKKQGDYAYLLQILRSLRPTGRGACILPHGVLFRGGAEGAIRRNLVQRGYIKGIIGLPPNLFFGTGIPACIVVLDKEGAAARKGIFLIDASKGFRKEGPKNRLRAQDIHKIVDTFTRQSEVPRYARMVPVAEISDPKNDYNLNLPRYIDSTEPEDLPGHQRSSPRRHPRPRHRCPRPLLAGHTDSAGHPVQAGRTRRLLRADRRRCEVRHLRPPRVRCVQNQRGGAASLRGRPPIGHASQASRRVASPSRSSKSSPRICSPRSPRAPLLDAYDIYQHLMDQWDDSMQDDCYLIAADGWREAAMPRLVVEDKTRKTKEKPDFALGKKKYVAELLPPALGIARYFADEQAAIEKLEGDISALQQQVEELVEEHGREGGLLEDARNEKDKLTKASVAARLKEVKDDADAADERAVLARYLTLNERDAAATAALKAARDFLTEKLFQQYDQLTEDDIKTLVVDDKWMARLTAAVQGELDRASQTLTGRIRQLAERYDTPMPKLKKEVEALTARVDHHLKQMGAAWS